MSEKKERAMSDEPNYFDRGPFNRFERWAAYTMATLIIVRSSMPIESKEFSGWYDPESPSSNHESRAEVHAAIGYLERDLNLLERHAIRSQYVRFLPMPPFPRIAFDDLLEGDDFKAVLHPPLHPVWPKSAGIP